MDLALIALIVSIFTLAFSVLMDLKKVTHALIQKRYYNRYFDKLIDQLYFALYIRLFDKSNNIRNIYLDGEDRNRRFLDSYAYLDNVHNLIKNYQEVQSSLGGFFSKNINRKIDLLESIYYIGEKNLNLQALSEIIYTGNTAYNNMFALEALSNLIKDYKDDSTDEYIYKILDNRIYNKVHL